MSIFDGEIEEATNDILVSINFGFPSNTVGGKVTAIDTNVHALEDHASASGAGSELLVAPIRLQVPDGIGDVITILRVKDDGTDPLISDTDCILSVMWENGFQIYDEVRRIRKLFYHFSTAIGSQYFFWSAGY